MKESPYSHPDEYPANGPGKKVALALGRRIEQSCELSRALPAHSPSSSASFAGICFGHTEFRDEIGML